MFDDAQADALLTGLIERYSPSTQERLAVEYLVAQMGALGFNAYIDDAGNAVGFAAGVAAGETGREEKTILLLGHIDTVPGFIPVRREGDLLYGRGAVDAKGPLATFVAAAARAEKRTDRRIVVVGAVEEEWATSKGARFLLDRISPDAVVIGEPSGWEAVTVGYKGRLLADYTLVRPLGHTAGPQAGACEKAVAFWQRVAGYAACFNADRPRMFDQLTPSLRQINSDDDGFNETVRMTIGLRLPEAIDGDALERDLTSLAGSTGGRVHHGGEFHRLQFRGREAAFRASRSSGLARAFFKAIHAQGGALKFQVKSGTSDMNVVGPAWNCPILAYGPGDSTLDHTPHEHIDLREYHQAIAVLAWALKDL